MSTLETEIHAWLVAKADGMQKNIKGLSQTTLSKMRKGKSGITTKNLARVLELNGHTADIVIEHKDGNKTTLKIR